MFKDRSSIFFLYHLKDLCSNFIGKTSLNFCMLWVLGEIFQVNGQYSEVCVLFLFRYWICCLSGHSDCFAV